MRLLEPLDELLVPRLVHQPGVLARPARLQPEEPPGAHRVLVHLAGRVDERSVDFGDRAVERELDVGGRLDRLDDDRVRTLRELAADLGQLDVDEVAELLLCVAGDADHHRAVVLEPQPLVGFGELELTHRDLQAGSRRRGPARRECSPGTPAVLRTAHELRAGEGSYTLFRIATRHWSP